MTKPINRIVFATQKGGVGKSTSATLLASYLYFVKDQQVVVIDADYPQHSIHRLRALETKRLQDDENLVKAFLATGKEQVYPIANAKMTHVFDRPAPDQASVYEKASLPKIGADVIIIDTPGSVAVDGLGSILQNVDTVVIPLEPEEMSLLSSTQFLGALGQLIKATDHKVKIVAFWNKIRRRSHAELIEVQNPVLQAMGVHVLDHYLPESVKMKRSETRSTVIPVDFRALDLSNFMEELSNATSLN